MKTKLVNGQKLAPQFRTATIALRASDSPNAYGAQLDEENRMVRGVSVSSDDPYERGYGMEILKHETGAIVLDRVTKGAAPLLYNHDRDALIGKVSNPVIKDGKLYVDFKFSQSEAGQQMLADLKDGILTECSIGYDVNRFEVDEDEETYTALLWTLYECSLVSIPADFTVGVGRAAGEETPVEIVPAPKKDIDTTRTDENNHFQETSHTRETNMEIPAAPTAAEIEAKETKAKQDGQREERERVNGIQILQKHYSEKGLGGRKIDTSEVAAQFIKDGKTVAEFRDAVMDGTFKDVTPLDTPDEHPEIRVIGERKAKGNDRRSMSVGAEFVRSKDFQEKGPQIGTKRTIGLEFPDLTMLGIRGKVAMAQRAGFASPDLAAVNVQIQTGVIGLGMQRLTVMDILAPGIIGAAALIYPKENSFGTVDGVAVAAASGGAPGMPRAQTVGERGKKPKWDPDLTTDTATVKKVAITTTVPDEFLADFPASQSYIDERLPFMVDTETEYQLLYGDGLNNNLKGIFSNMGVQTRAILTTDDSTIAASLKKGLTDVQVGSYFEPDFYAFHPYDWETASLLKDSTGRFLMGGPFYIPYTGGVYMEMYTFWGKPVVKSTAVNYGRPVCGAGKLGAQYFIREGMRLEMSNSNNDDFERNMISVRAEHRLTLATYRPVSFLEFTGFPARS